MNFDISNIIIGTLLGALISSIGYLYNRRSEKKKVLNKALFSLLELWWQLNKVSNINLLNVIEIAKERLQKEKPNLTIGELPVELINKLSRLLKNYYIQNDYNLKSDTLENVFQQTLTEICNYSPILAFDLNKNHSLKNVLTKFDDYMKLVIDEFQIESPEDISKLNKTITDQLVDTLMIDTLKTLEKDIKKLAFKCGIYKYYGTRKILRKKRDREIDKELLDSIYKNLFSLDN